MNRLLLHLLVIFLVACSDSKKNEQAQSGQAERGTTELSVVVLGGPTCPRFVKDLNLAGVVKARDLSQESLAGKAAALHAASVAIILVDATMGPLPVNREDIVLTRQFCRGTVMVGFSNSALIEDAELIELEVFELRNLLNKYDQPGDNIAMGFDSEFAKTSLPKGFGALATLVGRMKPAEPPPPAKPVKEVPAGLYVMNDMEAFKRGITGPVASGSYRVIFGDKVVPCALQAPQAVQPGSSGTVTLAFSETLNLCASDRFVIGTEEHVIAAGSVGSSKR